MSGYVPEEPMATGSRMAVGLNRDGRLEAYFIGFNDDIYRNWQRSPSKEWSGIFPYRGYAHAQSLVMGQNNDGRLEMFYIGYDNWVYHAWQGAPGDGFKGWRAFNCQAKAFALGRNRDGRLELFYTDNNSEIWHTWQSSPGGEWSKAQLLGGAAKALTVGRNKDGRLELFFVGMDDEIYHRWQSPDLAGWQPTAPFGVKAKVLRVISNSDECLDLFYVGPDDTLCHKRQTSPNSPFTEGQSFGKKASAFTVGRNADGRLEVFFIGNDDDAIYHMWQMSAGGNWSPVAPLGGKATSLQVGRNADGRLELFYFGKDRRIYHNWQTSAGNGWAREHLLDSDDRLFVAGRQIFKPEMGMHVNDHCFIHGKDGLWHMFGIEALDFAYPPRAEGRGHFVHAVAAKLNEGLWQRHPTKDKALERGLDESALWAPHVVEHNGTYYMFYCSGSSKQEITDETDDDRRRYRISLATSTDLVNWTREGALFEDGYQARDPMVLQIEGKWVMYYTATEDPSVDSPYVVACRTSSDLASLTGWREGERKIVYRDTHAGKEFGPTESPYVVQRGDYYYLFIGPRPYGPTSPAPKSWPNWRDPGYDGTDVFRSRRWDSWTDLDYVGHIPAHAAEVVCEEGDWYVSHAGIYRGGLYLLPLQWRDDLG